MKRDLISLLKRVGSANGRDAEIDLAIAQKLDASCQQQSVPRYTASVDTCLELIGRALPGWHWHVGYGPKGILPYAFVAQGEARYEAKAATVPLALLAALLKARISQGKGQAYETRTGRV